VHLHQDVNTKYLNDKQMAKLRLQKIGFVFQNFNLIALLGSKSLEFELR
jgi:ABC-type lipoprotein export system ATPase subunit